MNQLFIEHGKELATLCDSVRQLINKSDYSECEKLIADAMSKYPHAPQPHNLMGVLFVTKSDQISAMKHFRAAWSLDPTYAPARHNLDNFASLYSGNGFAFDENDLS